MHAKGYVIQRSFIINLNIYSITIGYLRSPLNSEFKSQWDFRELEKFWQCDLHSTSLPDRAANQKCNGASRHRFHLQLQLNNNEMTNMNRYNRDNGHDPLSACHLCAFLIFKNPPLFLSWIRDISHIICVVGTIFHDIFKNWFFGFCVDFCPQITLYDIPDLWIFCPRFTERG